jgi:hypothetical protein
MGPLPHFDTTPFHPHTYSGLHLGVLAVHSLFLCSDLPHPHPLLPIGSGSFRAKPFPIYRGADKSLTQPTSLSIVFSVQGTGVGPTGPDPENRLGDQDIGSPGMPVSSGLQVPGELFPSWSG